MTDTMITQMPKYESMQDSGFEWIGDIPSSWNLLSVKQIYRLVMEESGKNHNLELLSVYSDIGVRPRAELEEKGNKASSTDGYWLVRKGDFVVNKLLAWMGGLGLSEYDGVTSPAYDVLRPRKEICGSYFNYLFRSPACTSELKKHSRGIMDMRLRLYFDKFGVVKVPFPSLKEQKAISNFLDKRTSQIDEAIAIKQKQIELLKERKQIIIQKAVTQGLDSNVPLKESGIIGLGLVAEHWDIVFNRRVFRENSRKVKGDELPLSLSQVDGVIPSNDMKERSLSPSHRNNFKLCFPGDLVVNRFKGHLGVFFNSEYEGIVTFHYGVFEPQKGVHTKFYEHLYHTEPFKAIYAGASNGMTVGLQNLSNQNFYMIKTIRPPEKEQIEICKYIEKISDEINVAIGGNELQIERLKEYKATLINSAVTGKIKVTELS
ncbi:restriction endonuclease subunit S [Vibrio sp. vnigr-6D03]|uniref:restriction endonuclease subunit S n=1 Tax=Vibrio sp. vnigr-6D03 TaxID=2058088 RepID=UPI0015E1280F|nr:restriction endonuclease subunit S [Vibrio sp. vnigr-6D03]